MKPVNKKERAKAFNKVIGLFVLSLVLALLVGFTTMFEGNLSDRQSVSQLKQREAQETWERETLSPNLLEASATLDKVPTAAQNKENLDELNNKIGLLLVEAKKNLVIDDTWKSILYQDILKVYSDLHVAYKKQLQLEEQLVACQNNTQGSNVDLQRYISEVKELKQENLLLKATGGGGGGGGGGNTAQLQSVLDKAQEDLRKCRLQNKSLETEVNKLRNR